MNKSLKWFGRIVWIGILINLSMAIPAILSPRLLNITLGLGAESSDVWLRKRRHAADLDVLFLCRRRA